MSLDASMPVVFAQMAHVQKIAHNETANPEVQQATAKILTAEALKHEQSSVEKPQAAEESQLLLDSDAHQGGKKHQEKQHARAKHPEPEEEDTTSSNSPWQGNILDVKV